MENFKEVFESDAWIITSIEQGLKNNHLVNAKRRFPVADSSNFFSGWGSTPYLTRLARENYGVEKLSDMRNYRY